MSELGKRILARRTLLNIRQKDLADLSGLSVSYVSMVERGDRVPHLIRVLPPSGVQRMADGVPTGMDAARLRSLGNAVSPVVAEHVGRCVMRHWEAACAS